MQRKLDLNDKKIGNLKVVCLSHLENKVQYWFCICDCGKEIKIPKHRLVSTDTNKSCGCTKYRNHGNRKLENATTASWKSLYKRTRNTAKHRNLKWIISFEEFYNLSNTNCHYCKSEPNKKYNVYITLKGRYTSLNTEWCDKAWIIFNGLDRIDSSKDYSIENVVSCCTYCNFAKNDKSYDDFLRWLKRVAKVWNTDD